MGKLIVELYGNPVLFVITLLCFLGFVGMTYEFILRLFGKSSIMSDKKEEDDEDIVKVNLDSENEEEKED